MNLDTIERVATSQAVWAILFIALTVAIYLAVRGYIENLQAQNQEREEMLFSLYEQQRAESKEREERLMAHLEKTTETLGAISDNLADLQRQVKDGFEDIWTHLRRRNVT